METPQLTFSDTESWAERFATALGQQRNAAGELFAAHRRRLEQAVAFVQRQIEGLEEELKAAQDAAEQLRVDRDALADRLAAAESGLTQAERQGLETLEGGDCRTTDEDLRLRHAMAMEDLREANGKNAELQQQLAKARSSAAMLARQSPKPGRLDWESEKQRILVALEDDDEEDEAQKSERLATNEVLRITDKVIAMKDREIQELKQRLEEVGVSKGPHAAEEAALKQAINADAAILEERQRLQELQKEWREKLRATEVELSLERAKIARERAVLEEQIRTAQTPPTDGTSTEGQPKRSPRGRWLSQLGLTAADREPARHL